MLKMNSTSKNFDGISQVGDEPIVAINGSITSDSFYVTISASDIAAVQQAKEDVSKDVAEFIETMLS